MPVGQANTSFPVAARLWTPAEFSRVFKHGRFSSDGCFRVYVHPNGPIARLGISVARAAVAGAVVRNRLKRQIRASFRARRATLPAADIVVQVKAHASGASKPELCASLEWHWQEVTKRCAAS
ncbi:MAG: ribonuclease P protein component [Gammaproteobacteria bacterium]